MQHLEVRRSLVTALSSSRVSLGGRYSADITAGSLKVAESRIIADLLLRGLSGNEWHRAIVEQNVLQVRNPRTAVRIARLIHQRLTLMKPDLWRLIRDASGLAVDHALLAAAIKHSPLLGDFLDIVVRERLRMFETTLPKRLFDEYLQDCRGRDPGMPQWRECTHRKLQTTIYHILVQAGYLSDTRALTLLQAHIADPVLAYLRQNNEVYVLRCIQVGP